MPLLPVLLPLPLGRLLSYEARETAEMPAGSLIPGSLVRVPLGRREVYGVIWDGPAEPLKPGLAAKAVLGLAAAGILPEPLRRLVDWVAAYTLAAPGAVLKMALPMPEAYEGTAATRRVIDPVPALPELRPNPQRQRVLALAAERPGLSAADLAHEAGVTPSVVRRLVELGALAERHVAAVPPRREPDGRGPGPDLNPEQFEAAKALAEAVRTRQFSPVLLEGVTGSGKTEVYFEAIAAALREGRQALVLLPEIALTQAWLDRFERRFDAQAWPWHSELSPGRRAETLRAIGDGRARVVVGARSALFLPYADLGLVVVDEEHDASFKQEEGVIYSARDMAVVRAKQESIPVLLTSATPSFETLANVERGRYAHLTLTRRHGAARLPEINLIDLRKHAPPPQKFIAPPLIEAVSATLAEGEQAMLFLNRRGYAPLTLCGACGHRLECPNCSAWLVEHRRLGRLQCHHCGFNARPPEACPSCGEAGRLKPCGPGVERLAEEAAALFPEARLGLMASDTMTAPRQIATMLEDVAMRRIDILIGTQIVAKGHHFPGLTLVGVIDADLGLGGGDPRAAERTWQLLTQVAGRAGRAERPGRVLLQSYQPEHPVIAALARRDTDGFRKAELAERRRHGLPPFGRLAALIVSGADLAEVQRAGRALAQNAPEDPALRVLGPAPAPLSLLRGRHRERLLLKAGRGVDVSACLREWIARVNMPNSVKLAVDVDPYSFS